MDRSLVAGVGEGIRRGVVHRYPPPHAGYPKQTREYMGSLTGEDVVRCMAAGRLSLNSKNMLAKIRVYGYGGGMSWGVVT